MICKLLSQKYAGMGDGVTRSSTATPELSRHDRRHISKSRRSGEDPKPQVTISETTGGVGVVGNGSGKHPSEIASAATGSTRATSRASTMRSLVMVDSF